MNKSISYIILLIAFPFYFTGCKKEVRPTSMTIKDSTGTIILSSKVNNLNSCLL